MKYVVALLGCIVCVVLIFMTLITLISKGFEAGAAHLEGAAVARSIEVQSQELTKQVAIGEQEHTKQTQIQEDGATDRVIVTQYYETVRHLDDNQTKLGLKKLSNDHEVLITGMNNRHETFDGFINGGGRWTIGMVLAWTLIIGVVVIAVIIIL